MPSDQISKIYSTEKRASLPAVGHPVAAKAAANGDEWNDEWSWLAIERYFDENGMVQQQIDSFDKFIDHTMQAVIDETTPLEFTIESRDPSDMRSTWVELRFGRVFMTDARVKESDGTDTLMTPNIARLRNLTYAAPSHMMIKRTIARIDPASGKKEDVHVDEHPCGLGDIPIMLRSKSCILSKGLHAPLEMGECMYDEGGYFVINGSEKVLIAQERINMNQIYVFHKMPKNVFEAQIRSVGEASARPGIACYIRCYLTPPRDCISKIGPVLRVTLPYCKKELPLCVVFRALGLITDRDIMEYVCYGLTDMEMTEAMKSTLEDGALIKTRLEALDYIGSVCVTPGTPLQGRIEYAEKIMREECFPHIGMTVDHASKKAYFLGYMAHRLMMTKMNRRQPDDRDHFANKRMDTSGALMGQLFRSLFYQMTKTAKRAISAELNKANFTFKISSVIDEMVIGRGLKYSLSTGNWGATRNSGSSKIGVSQVLNRLSFASTLSHMRRLNTPLGRDGKLARPRQLHNTHWGMVCPAETPEGHACGLVKNLSMMAYITIGTEVTPILETLQQENVILLTDCKREDVYKASKVIVNGSWIGIHRQPTKLVEAIRSYRRDSTISYCTSVNWDIVDNEVRIQTDAGRICRPLFVVDDMKLKFKSEHVPYILNKEWNWSRMKTEGLVEYIDVEEEESSMVVMNPWELIRHRTDKQQINPIRTYTHCEIHPSMILGVCASIIPFPDHNQSPRVVYQSAMGKQAIGIHTSNFQERFDTLAHSVMYPQKPLAATRGMEHLKFNELPAGQNTIVAISCYSGYNQEDSLILNRSSIDRGWQRSTYHRTYRDEEKNNQKFTLPNKDSCSGSKRGSYAKLDNDGLVSVGERVSNEDILMGKIVPVVSQNGKPATHRDVSSGLKSKDSGVVDGVMVTSNEKGQKMVKVRVRSIRIPQIGDKFASRHGQKGTCGMLYRQEELPFSSCGMVPDLVMNPHAIPSRMTIGHLFETLLSKVATLTGQIGDATAFMPDMTVKTISDLLHDSKFQRYGMERMYNGNTGRELESMIYMGPVYYQRLKHMVDDKVHSRARGPHTSLVRQPTEGRSRDGGLRFGEMERDCMISHGAAAFLRERLFLVSDQYRVPTCNKCGLFAIANFEKNTFMCKACPDSNVSTVFLPYSCKLLFQELMSMAIAPRMLTDD